jgi:hypothetical protein
MAPSTPSAERIEQQMQSLRSELCADARSLVSGARDLTDWTAYVRRYPWLCLGAAAAIGYLAIPRRRRDLRTADPAADQAAERPVVVMWSSLSR